MFTKACKTIFKDFIEVFSLQTSQSSLLSDFAYQEKFHVVISLYLFIFPTVLHVRAF